MRLDSERTDSLGIGALSEVNRQFMFPQESYTSGWHINIPPVGLAQMGTDKKHWLRRQTDCALV